MQIFGRQIDLSLTSARAAEQNLYDPALLQMHVRALRTTDYGASGLIKADIRDNRVKYILTVDGSEHLNLEEAVARLSVTGFTTYARISKDLAESTIDQRGTGGLRERLLQMQKSLEANPEIAERFGIRPDEISGIKFVTGTVSATATQETENMLKRLENAIIVADEKEANVMQILVGSGQTQRQLTRKQILEILDLTSDGAGGLLATEELISQLKSGKLGSLFSKLGKRVRGAIGLKGVSLSGEELTSSLTAAQIGSKTLDEKSIRIFDPEEELFEAAENFVKKLNAQGALGEQSDEYKSLVRDMFNVFKEKPEEKRAFYRRSGAEGLITSALKREKILIEKDGILTVDQDLLKQGGIVDSLKEQFGTAYDGSSLMNKRYVQAIRQQFIEERNLLMQTQGLGEHGAARIKELASYIDALNYNDFQAITGRVFFTGSKGQPNLLKTVFGMADFEKALDQYAIITTKKSVKREAGILAGANTLNLTLQKEPSGRVYYDPLAPAFHYDIFDEKLIESTRKKQARVLGNLRQAIEEGQIPETLRRQITAAANEDIFSPHISQAQREIAQRNRLFMRQLKDAMDSGVDIRALPNLMNYLTTFASADLYRYKDGVFQPALEGAFRFALNNETVFRGGNRSVAASTLGEGFERISFGTVEDPRTLQAAKFEIQGHSLLFGGNATHIFKQSLGGFDLDDHGIVIPRIFEDLSGKQRLGHFIYRQPTGHGEFVFGRSSFRSASTIAGIFGQEEIYREYMENLSKTGQMSEAQNLIYQSLNMQEMSRMQQVSFNAKMFGLSQDQEDEIEKTLIKMLEDTQTAKTVNLTEGIFAGMTDYASPIALNTVERTRALAEAGVLTEATAAKLYTHGQMLRIFAEEGTFDISEELHADIRSIVSQNDFEQLESLKNQSKKYQEKLAKIMQESSDENLRLGIKTAVSMDQQRLSEGSIALRGSIGKYTNRYTIAASGGDQTEAILRSLQEKGETQFVNAFRKNYMLAFGPSDVVDALTNLNPSNPNMAILGVQQVAEEMQQITAIYGQDNPEVIKRSIERIMRKRIRKHRGSSWTRTNRTKSKTNCSTKS